MKKIIIILITICMTSACSDDFANLAPISDRNEKDFYTNANDFLVSLNAGYALLQDPGVYGRAYWAMFEMRSDNTDQGPDATGLARQYTVINQFTEDPLNEQVEAAWSASYRVIANCNVILERIEGIEIETGLKDRIIGETLFLRSLMYYHLAVAFGNIPLQLRPFILGEELTQVDAATVYGQLVSDLMIAEGHLPISYPESDMGRATKGAAATLLAKVQLTLGNTSDAETVLRRIISDYNYELVPNYADLWGPANENNVESIFEVQFLSGAGTPQGSLLTNEFSPSADLQTGEGFGRNRPTEAMKNAYEAGDQRFEISMGTTFMTNDGEEVVQNFVRKYESDPPLENDSDNNFVVFRYADVLLMLAEAIGESSESYALINEVRTRAGLADIDGASPGSFQEKLLKERQVELAFENHRWADLKRFGVVTERLTAAEPDVINAGDIRSLYFIPQREMDINTNFTQNSN